jgi:hypothetical protein
MNLEAELDAALVRELCTGRKLAEVLENKREIFAAQEAHAMRGHKTLNSLGKAIGTVPQDTYFKIIQFQGREFWEDKGEVRDFFKKHPHLKSHNI